jgi:hypothetical protein
VVHHLNGIKDDNRIENLIALPRREHHPSLDPQIIKNHVVKLEMEITRLRGLLQEKKSPTT